MKEQDRKKIVFGKDPVLPYSVEEALNRLRINMRFFGSDVRKIMIVSSEPNEGKSFVSLNLWRQMARAGETSVLVDADMRNSHLAKAYDMKYEDGTELKGTSQYLSEDAGDLEAFISHTEFPAGDIMPNIDNVVNPLLLLETERFSDMLKQLGQRYRYVFVDVPPLEIVSDAERIGSLCDGAILVVRSNQTSRNLVRHTIQQLDRADCPLLGMVLNRVDVSQNAYYHKHYGKYGKYGKKRGMGYGYYGYGDAPGQEKHKK